MSKNNKGKKVTPKTKVIPTAPKVETPAATATEQPAAEPIQQPAAPQQEPAKKDAKKLTQTKVNVIQVGDLQKAAMDYRTGKGGGLDANHQVELLSGLKGMFHDDPNAAKRYGMSEDTVDEINSLTSIGFVTVLVNEIQFGTSPFATRMKVAQLESIKKIAPMLGVEIDSAALPAPDENGEITVESKAVKISKETKEAAKKEKAVMDKTPITDPSKITNEAELKQALSFILGDTKVTPQPFTRINNVISFYKSYLQIMAKKANDDAKYNEVEKTNRIELLSQITKICGDIPFSTSGFAHYVTYTTSTSKSPLKAFLTLKKASLSSSLTFDDQYIADMAKIFVIWGQNNVIDSNKKSIVISNKNIETLSKDKEKNAEAIKKETEKIETYNGNIAHAKDVIDLVNFPDDEIVKNLVANYGNSKADGHKLAVSIFELIIANYYPKADVSDEANMKILVNNVQQQAGIIINMFRDPSANIITYSIANLEPVKEVVEEEVVPETQPEPTATEEPVVEEPKK